MTTATQYVPDTKKERVAEAIRELIIVGTYQVGDALPSLETFTEQADNLIGVPVSPGTVRDGEGILAESHVVAAPQQGTATRVTRVPEKVYGDWVSPAAIAARNNGAGPIPMPRAALTTGPRDVLFSGPADPLKLSALVPDESLLGAILAWEQRLVARIEALEAKVGG